MDFASDYLGKRALFNQFIAQVPDDDTGIIIIIPAFDDPGILKTIKSLSLCKTPECAVEVLVIINAPPSATDKQIKSNKQTQKEIEIWKAKNEGCFFHLFCINTERSSNNEWGAGMARKTGMDEAVRRFDFINKPDGLIVSLDADCLVSTNYLTSLEEKILANKKVKACVLYFEHPLEGKEFHKNIYKSICEYELHLRYYYQALKYTGYPNVFHTIGSALAVKAGPYIKVGGMSRKQAGEDFYFIQKLIPTGGIYYLRDVTVYPSPRLSERVPFGTGPALVKMAQSDDIRFYTYNIQAFTALSDFFNKGLLLFDADSEMIEEIVQGLSVGLYEFLKRENYLDRIIEIRANTSGGMSFVKRFYQWFNLFKIVKYLNFVHSENFYLKVPVCEVAILLLSILGQESGETSCRILLKKYRDIEK